LTLLNIAAVESRRRLERACDESEVQRLFDLVAIEELLGRSGGCRGAGALRSMLEEHAIGTTLTRSELEERMLALCRAAGLPLPVVNEPVVGGSGRWHCVDFLWADRRVIVETDGHAFHSTRRAIEPIGAGKPTWCERATGFCVSRGRRSSTDPGKSC